MEEEQKKPVEEPTEDLGHVPEDSNLSAIDVAKKLHEQIKSENDRHEKLIIEEQKLRAEQLLAGTGGKGIETKPEFSDEEKASRARIKSVADASGADWGKNYG